MKDQLIFNTATAASISDSDSVGAYVRSSDGTLVTNTTDGAREALDVYTELAQSEDAAHVSGDTGVMSLSVRMDDVDGANSALIAGTEGDYQAIFTNAKGEMHTRDNDAIDILTTIDTDTGTIASDTTSIDATLTALSKAEDAVHGSGDQGIMSLAVRNDAGTPLAADGDYIPMMVNEDGSLYTYLTGSDPLTINDAALANTAIANATNTLDSADTAEDVVASPLASRKYLWIYNLDNQKVYIGASGVSAANGFPLSGGAYLQMRAGAAVDIEFVGSTGKTPEIRTLELS